MDFVKQYQNVLGKYFCTQTIMMFEKDNDKTKGINIDGLDETVKIKMDLHSDTWKGESWSIIYSVLQDALHSYIIKYYEELGDKFKPYTNTRDSGFQIQYYKANIGKYEFHNDFWINENGFRTLSYIFYLNSVDDGGETEFYNGIKVKPEQGKLLFFPSLWTYSHKGNIPISNDKYIITGWIYSNY